jgi:hypothetical protein
LIKAQRADILALPLDPGDLSLREDLEPEAKTLIGFWTSLMRAEPSQTGKTTKWGSRSNKWGPIVRARIARQVEWIKHWVCIPGDYTDAVDCVTGPATWFIDPPYQHSGTFYPESSKAIDFKKLADWCQSLPGQVIVCEEEGATWLPFEPLQMGALGRQLQSRTAKTRRREVYWMNAGMREKRQRKGLL